MVVYIEQSNSSQQFVFLVFTAPRAACGRTYLTHALVAILNIILSFVIRNLCAEIIESYIFDVSRDYIEKY